MKKPLRAILSLILLLPAFAASAQESKFDIADGNNAVWVEYNPGSFKTGDKTEGFNAFSVSYSRFLPITEKYPLALEFGFGMQYLFYSNSLADDIYGTGVVEPGTLRGIHPKEHLRMFSLRVPVNIAYDFFLNTGGIIISPYTGFTINCNLWGNYKLKWHATQDFADRYEQETGSPLYDLSLNPFDDDDMGGHGFSRFTVGWQVGVNVRFLGNYIAGVSYGTDFGDLGHDISMRRGAVKFGFYF